MIQLEMIQSLTNAFPPQRTAVPDPGPDGQGQMGFFTDTTLCIGCKACEVACKQWNQLPSDGFKFTGNSYDNTEASGGDDLAARGVPGADRRDVKPLADDVGRLQAL